MQSVKKVFGIWTMILFVFVVLAAGCSSESGSSKNNNLGSDAAVEEDAQFTNDSDNYDASTEADDASDGQKDVAADVEQDDADDSRDTSTADASDDVQEGVEVGDTSDDASTEEDITEGDVSEETDVPSTSEDPYEIRPQGQCNETLDCEIMASGFRSCTRTAPGGLCAGCGDNDCGIMAECKFGTCQALCSSKEDCAPGLTCMSGGICGIERCVNNKCPTPMFGCNANGFCERVACTQQSDCPTLTTCSDGLCIEDRQL